MFQDIEQMVDAFEAGKVSRRQLIGGLGAVVAAAMAGSGTGVAATAPLAGGGNSTFKGLGLNHIALRCTDIPRSRDFYVKHFGMRVLQEGPQNCFLGCGANNFLALFRSEKAALHHYCHTIEGYEPDKVMEVLDSLGLTAERHQNRVYFDDPDGITVQVASEWGDYPGEAP